MAPLILHNVPDDELYVGDDGVQRPYAMVFPQQDGIPGTTRARRNVPETGSFGKSTRRSRSRTGTPARRENPTLAAADKIFGDWIANQAATAAATTTTSGNATPTAATAGKDDATASAPATPRLAAKPVPTEIVLRGYRSAAQQYAALNHYEQLAGRICEDYSREPPAEHRRYKSDLRDRGLVRRRPLAPEERAKVNRAAAGEHWVKVTFESAEAADAALFASPQPVLGHLVVAEPWLGMPPTKDEALPDVDPLVDEDALHARSKSMPAAGARSGAATGRDASRAASSFPAGDLATPSKRLGRLGDFSPEGSHASSHTIETGTLSTATPRGGFGSGSSSDTLTGAYRASTTARDVPTAAPTGVGEDGLFCRRIPTARRMELLPADQALLPQPSYTQRVLNKVPFLKWFSGSMIGNEVPRTDLGEFDWNRASLYWKAIWWLDATFRLFGGEIASADKDD